MTLVLSIQDNHPEKASFYRTLLESTKAIPWRIDWKTMQLSPPDGYSPILPFEISPV